jgi:L-threonylcarbamoyladenylate synthase
MSTDLSIPLATIDKAITILQASGVGVMPTDTVYGLVARAQDEQAVTRLYALKKRENKPGTIIAANTDQLLELGVDHALINEVKQWWPNPLSVILPLPDTFAYLHQNVGDIAVRVVADESVRKVLQKTGPLVTSSANHPGKPGATTIEEAWQYFKDTVDFYVDGGNLDGRASSTIIRITDNNTIEILRQGAFQF